MFFIDTHTHLYLNAFDDDRPDTIGRAIQKGVGLMLLPNIDSGSVDAMHELCHQFPKNCYPMMGLHPTSVKENWKEELQQVENYLHKNKYCAVGEIGLDFYWDLTFSKEQETVFLRQAELALQHELPIVIHSRQSMDETIALVKSLNDSRLTGVFHCFSGSYEQAKQIVDLGFKLGIGGVVTYKNSKLGATIGRIGLGHLLLETDSPFITPVPFRGKRNESANIPLIAAHVAEFCGATMQEVADITTQTAKNLFKNISLA